MKVQTVFALLLPISMLAAQNATDTPEAHVAIAKTAAGEDYQNLFNFLCAAPAQRGGGGGRRQARQEHRVGKVVEAREVVPRQPRGQGGGQRGAPDRSTWYAEPVKVADNLYFVGQSEYSVWAITTSEGIILIDAIFDYSVEEEVDGGLKKLGLDPTKIKYAIVTHPHPDHYGGGKFLQDKYGAKVLMSAADWDVLDRANGTKPTRDMVATDGQKLTLGDTTLTLYITPGHTPGTISTIPGERNGKPHRQRSGGDGTQRRPGILDQLHRVGKAVQRHCRQAGADIIVSNHTDWDRSKINLPSWQSARPAVRIRT